jgi:hypothetical protein
MARKTPTTGSDARAAREALELSQAALAALLGVSDRMIRKVEKAELIPAGYRDTYKALSGGRVIAPERTVTTVRAKGGGTVTVKPAKGGTDTGVTFARGTSKGASVVRRTVEWMPYGDAQSDYRDHAAQAIHAAVADAHAHGMAAVVTVSAPSHKGAGGSQAGYDVTVIGLPEGARAPRGALVVDPGDDFDAYDLDDLADDAGLHYVAP